VIEGVGSGLGFRRGTLVARAPRVWAFLNAARLTVLRPTRFAGALCRGSSASRAVAMTFDDGPDPENTLSILDSLDRVSARATFFFTGEAIEKYPDIARRAALRHEIGTHLYSHDRAMTRSRAAFEGEVARCMEIHARLLGKKPTALRFPFGDRGCVRLLDAQRLGLTPYHWTFSSEDSSAASAEDVVSHVLPRLHSGAIVLFHDGRGPGSTKGTGSRRPTVEALPRILEAALRRELRLETVSELCLAP
jgi:peptidoglycan/xylan/chitin deacetylase (PgdA/CDA1 family)